MFFLLVIILLLTIFLLLQKNRSMNKQLIILVLSYFIALASMILYISKDTFYYNLVKEYFYLPGLLWKWLFFISIDKSNIIRLMNVASLGILVISTYFSLHFYRGLPLRRQKITKNLVWFYAVLQLVIYDPSLNILAYKFLYPDYMTVQDYLRLENIIYSCTKTINIIIILTGFLNLILAIKFSPKLKLFRFHYIFLALSYAVLSLVYIYFISATPAFYMKISKISNTYSYRSIHLGSNVFVYWLFPYLLIPAMGLITYCAYRLLKLNSHASLEELCISKEISASETTSKIFCHYIKNEILSIQSEVIMLSEAKNLQAVQNTREDILKRCDTLYNRIDEIHRSTKTSELNLISYSIQKLLKSTLKTFAFNLADFQMSLNMPSQNIRALIDPVYMEQALHNIIRNALDAMEDTPKESKALIIDLTTVNNWIQIRITDTGKAISPENLDKIFLPFYSSHPYSRHWGVGLTLTYKVIRAHEGKILVDSTPGKGTSFEILLPNVNY